MRISLLGLLLVCLTLGAGAQSGSPSPASPSPTASATPKVKSGPLTISVVPDKQVIEIGQSMRVQVEISNAAGIDVKPVLPDKWDLKPFELQDAALARLPDEDGRQISRFTVRVSCFEEGEQTFPAIRVEYAKDQEAIKVSSDPFQVMVRKVPPGRDDKPGEIRDLKKMEDSPFPPALIALIVVVTLLLIYALYRLVRWWRRPKPIPVAPPLPPFELALQELDRIEQEKLWEQGQWELYYDQLTLVLRQYLGWRFKRALLEKTTSETLDALRDKGGFDYESWRTLKIILEEGDLVKFARQHPADEKVLDQLHQARTLLQKFPPSEDPKKVEAKSA